MRLSNIALAISALYGGFSPGGLFAGGVNGVWYDPSDLTTMFTTSAGTTPVAMPGQGSAVSVGLMLDKSQGLVLGPNIQNGGFDTDTIWTKNGWVISGGTASYAAGVGAAIEQLSPVTLAAGDWVRVTVTISAITSGFVYAYVAGSNISALGASATRANSAGTYTWYFPIATVTNQNVGILCGNSPGGIVIDNVTIQRISGNHAIAINDSTARPVLSARVNLLTYSEEFDNGAWLKVGGAVSANSTPAPDGTTTADTFTATAAYNRHCVINTGASALLPANTPVVFSAYIKKGNYNFVSLLVTNTTTTWFRATFDFSGASPVLSQSANGAGGTYISASVEAAANGFWRLVVRGSTTDTTLFGEICLNSSATPPSQSYGEEIWTAAGTETVIIWGADLRPANIGAAVPAYQRIADANTYDTAGFPLYLRFDGIDDGMYTPANLNLSATDKVGVFAGVRKNATVTQFPVEFSSSDSNNGAFGVGADSGGFEYFFNSRGTTLRQVLIDNAAYNAPVSNVVTLSADIAAPSLIARINATQVGSNTSSQGTGNFGTYPLYIGSRNNSSLYFNGHLHGLIVVGSAVSAGNISATESWMAGKTGLVLP